MLKSKIYQLVRKLWPINRSITGKGVRQTLSMLKLICPKLKIHEIPTGTKIFDWTIPMEWHVKDAWVKKDKSSKKIIDFKKNNLHLVGYSIPIKKKISLQELQKKIHSIKKQPNAIPYVTSYYKKDWGFCVTEKIRSKLRGGKYQVFIDSSLKKGSLSYGEIIIPGKSKKEVFLSTYVCHPSMANNELSGPVVTIYLAKWLIEQKKLNYSYRIIFIPETIGSITYIKKNLKIMKRNIFAGFNITCVGDNRAYSYLPSRDGNTLSDQVAQHVLYWTNKSYKKYTWLDRGSDERQYCSPGVDLPIASIMRTKYGEYPEYHTSLDKLKKVVNEKGLEGSYNLYKKVLQAIENNCYLKSNFLCEPHLSKRNLYPTTSKKNNYRNLKNMMNLISYADGKNSLITIAEKISVPIWELIKISKILIEKKVLKRIK